MRSSDWSRRLLANPAVSQKKTLRMLEMSSMAQTYIEKDPIDFSLRISMSWA
jgi:hypothetical protein